MDAGSGPSGLNAFFADRQRYEQMWGKIWSQFLPKAAGAKPTAQILPVDHYVAVNMRSCPALFWQDLHKKFYCRGRSVCFPGRCDCVLDPSNLWAYALQLLDGVSLSALVAASPEFACMYRAPGTTDILKSRLGANYITGPTPSLLRLCHHLDMLHCSFVSRWDGRADSINLDVVKTARHRFPEAVRFLWQTCFPAPEIENLSSPLAFVESDPPAVIEIGTTTLRFSLRLMCLARRFFDPQSPRKKLLARLEMKVDHGPRLWPGGKPGENGHTLCGDGHRWACVCQNVETNPYFPIFCSLRECYLRPAWRNPQVLAHYDRQLLQRCEPLEWDRVVDHISKPLRVLLSIYRVDDDDGPEEP